MTKRVQDLLRAIDAQNQWLQEESARLARLKQTHVEHIASYDAQAGRAWNDLAAALIPNLDPAKLDETSRLIRLREVSASGAAEARQKLERYLRSKLGAIEAEFPPAQTQSRLNELDIRLSELSRDMEPLEGPLAAVEAMAHFQEIIRSNYGTDEYAVPFWKFSYYRHWKHADLVIEAHGAAWGVTGFGEFRRKYLEQRAAFETFQAERVQLTTQQRELQTKAQEHARWSRQLENLDETVLQQLRDKVKEHLELLELDDVLELLGRDPHASVAAKRVAGVQKKREYLVAFYERYVEGMERDIQKMLAKNKKHAVKYRRPKHARSTWSDQEFSSRFGDRSHKWNERYRRYETARDRMWAWDEYDRYDPYDDRPWFIYIDDGSLKGRFLDDVSDYREDHARESHVEAAAERAVLMQEDDLLGSDFS